MTITRPCISTRYCGFPFDQRVVDTVRAYCEPLRESDVDTVILGCTHYPLVAPMLQRTLGRGVHSAVSL